MEHHEADSEPAFSILAYTTTWCPDCTEAHKILKRSGLPFTLIDVESVPGAESEMLKAASGVRKVPTIVIDTVEGTARRQVLIEPSTEELMGALRGLKERTNSTSF